MRLFGHYIDRLIISVFLVDLCVLALSFYGAYFARWADVNTPTETLIGYAPNAVAFVATTVISMVAFGCYEQTAIVRRGVMMVRLFAAFITSIVALSVLFYVAPELKIWRSSLVIAAPMALGWTMIVRFLFNDHSVARRFARRIMILSDSPLNDVALRQLGITDNPAISLVDCTVLDKGVPEQNDPSWLRDKARALGVDEIVVRYDERRDLLPIEALRVCRLGGLDVADAAAFAERETGRIAIDHVSTDWFVFSNGFTSSHIDRIAKRIFDVVVSLAVLLFTMPLILVSMLIIKLQDGGPVLYRQTRVGLHGREFELLKLRSMRVDAEVAGPQFARSADSRTTFYGRFMRRCRIDELPQLFNILRGEMSFVGPRPERPVFVEELAEKIPFFRERHMVKPGLSGWAQVNHAYADTLVMNQMKLEYDLYYVKNSSIILDIIVLMQTMRVVIWGSGAR